MLLNSILPPEGKSKSGGWRKVRGTVGLTRWDKHSVWSDVCQDWTWILDLEVCPAAHLIRLMCSPIGRQVRIRQWQIPRHVHIYNIANLPSSWLSQIKHIRNEKLKWKLMFSGFQDVAMPDQCVSLMRKSSSHFRKESSHIIPANASVLLQVLCLWTPSQPATPQSTLWTPRENLVNIACLRWEAFAAGHSQWLLCKYIAAESL